MRLGGNGSPLFSRKRPNATESSKKDIKRQLLSLVLQAPVAYTEAIESKEDKKMTFAQKLKEMRTRAGMSQEKLAEKVGVSRQAITKWETDKGAPDMDNLMALSDLFGVSVDELLGREARRQSEGYLYESVTEYDVADPKRYDMKLGGARRLTVRGYEGEKLRVTKNGVKYWTPMLFVFLTIGTTDVMFAFDSIPAIFGLTKDPFLVFTSNVFALLGLQQLYFLLGALLDKLVYLPLGLSVVLGFIGVKLILEALHGNTLPFINHGQPITAVPEVPTWLSLAVIVFAIGGASKLPKR